MYRTQLFIQMTQISQSRKELLKKNLVTQNAFDDMRLCLCSNDKTWKYCVRKVAEGDIWSDDRGSSGGKNSEGLHGLYW